MDKVICCVACLLIGWFVGFVSALAGINKLRPDLYDELKKEVFDERHDSRSELLKQFPVNMENPLWHFTGIRAAIEAAPAVDAVPVVRCEDCVHGKPSWLKGKEDGPPYCVVCRKHGGGLTTADFFCAFGEKRGDA